jgi:hypothetical protein
VVRAARYGGQVALRVSWFWAPFLAAPVALVVASAALAWWSRDGGVLVVTGGLLLQIAFGAAGSFVLHESSHAFVLGLCDGVERIDIESTLLRISLRPQGELTTQQAIAVALAGPGACVLVGIALHAALPLAHLHWWYLLHAGFLLPIFGDGRAVVQAVRHALSRES